MLDVSMAAGDPETDPKKKITNEDQYRGKDKSSWGQRAPSKKELIINNFSPGYAQQSIFAREYKPRVALLSIGGNDINFAGIIRTCVDVGEVVDTCYRYYEDRVGIMKQILGQYERLVKTYKSLMQESGSRLYVVGYPQIAKVGGDCGVNVRLDAKEVAFSAQLITYFNSVIKKAAAEAGAYYVDIETALNGSRLCEATMQQTGAVNGLTKGNDILWLVGNESFHPNTYGHRLMAQRIMINSTNMTAAMPRPVPNNKPTLDLNNSLLNGMPHAPEQ
jgi:lysophospholipase L1-like esterase